MIVVPRQKRQNVNYCFLFKTNKTNTLTFNMLPGLSYFFSAKFLAHRQVSRWTNPGQFCQPFFKFSSYRSAKMCSYCIDVLFKEILLKRKEKKEI